MPNRWTKERQRAAIRRPDGSFKEWKGGKDKDDLKVKTREYHGMKVHIGKEFKRQHGRKAKRFDIVRNKNKDGTYHDSTSWYVKTRHGWREAGQERPSKEEILEIDRRSRKSRVENFSDDDGHNSGPVKVSTYTKSDGTKVRAHTRSKPGG